jgi:hypothetical protein
MAGKFLSEFAYLRESTLSSRATICGTDEQDRNKVDDALKTLRARFTLTQRAYDAFASSPNNK